MWICNSAPEIKNPEFKSVTDWLYNIDLPTYISHVENGDDIIMFILKFVSIKWDNEFKPRCLVLSKYLINAIYHHSYYYKKYDTDKEIFPIFESSVTEVSFLNSDIE